MAAAADADRRTTCCAFIEVYESALPAPRIGIPALLPKWAGIRCLVTDALLSHGGKTLC
jgi:hypothetical protein